MIGPGVLSHVEFRPIEGAGELCVFVFLKSHKSDIFAFSSVFDHFTFFNGHRKWH